MRVAGGAVAPASSGGGGMGIARRSLRHDLPMSALFFDPDQIEPDDDLPRLIAKLAEASVLLEKARNGRMDALGDPVAFSYLLHEAQIALVESDERVKEEAALLDAVVRSAPDMIVYVAADGTVRWSNQQLPGHAAEAIVGAHWLSITAPTQRADLERV